MASWDEVGQSHQPVRDSVRIPMRADILERIASLEVQAKREAEVDKRENREPVAPKLAEKIQELEAELVASEVEFVFVGVGRREYKALIVKNPPTPAQKAEAEEAGVSIAYDPDAFPPALLAASCVEPTGTTLESWTEVYDEWSQGQVSQLWASCMAANMGSADAGPKSEIASEILRGSGKN